MPTKEIKSLTSIRGLAALYVAVGHCFEKTNFNKILPSFFKTFIHHFGLSVDLFFILSAYLLMFTSYKNFVSNVSFRNYLKFMWKRVGRIYPLLFICITFVFAVINHFTNPKDYFKGLSLILSLDGYKNSLFVLWSLRAEWITYLFFPVIIYWANKSNLKNIILITVVFLIITVFFNFYKYVSGIQSLFRCWFDYYFGILIFKMSQSFTNSNNVNKTNRYSDLGIISTIIILLFFPQTDMYVILLFGLLVLYMVKYNGVFSRMLENNFLHYLGLISYSIYLIHPLLIYYINYYNLQCNYLLFSLYFIILIIISSVTYTLIEKPFINLFKRISFSTYMLKM